jgi:hypothetical protein
MFTAAEQKWIDDMDKLARRKPKKLILYTTDSNIIVCKQGEPSHDCSDTIRVDINAGCYLTDMHDDMDNGENVAGLAYRGARNDR